ncbi:transglycosylase domain-containing protein [Arenicella xantha]|uniref:peptidoglycan glycosyltransferase n=1 Tax=Arenicella xantha TaxID=644221 RepID=A0A395JQ58_9GAMM|nr:transglycosylase domain-containing protein [Arenicella xantha]RBP52755.1 penicillin-binding protein 1C [Arenicella xantha]
MLFGRRLVAKWLRRSVLLGTFASVVFMSVLAVLTVRSMQPLPNNLSAVTTALTKPQLLDRTGRPLTITYQNNWNAHDTVALHQVPEFLQHAFILAEDKRFYQHKGIDWSARFNALLQNILALEGIRGASTISEQVVRMLHPRPRSVWARWVEGWEARELEQQVDKASILEFYLNQVPYAAQRRGVQQAATYYFDRDLHTLSQKEMLSLAVLVRAPSRFDLYKSTDRINGRLNVLIDRAAESDLVADPSVIKQQALTVRRPPALIDVSHFAQRVYTSHANQNHQIPTTLDTELQQFAEHILSSRLRDLAPRRVNNAGMIVVDHQTDEVLVWAVGNGNQQVQKTAYDTVQVKRQPGSTLKPFVYAMALEKDWTAATLIDDSPLSEGVGQGVHAYRNYSNTYYGPISVREALGNSLNIPAIKTAQYVGVEPLLDRFNQLGMTNLTLRSVDYGNGIALGNAEISLLELTTAYATLARGGEYRPLKTTFLPSSNQSTRVFSNAASSLIGNILSDPDARRREFGRGGTLHLPVQTAVKTGTSTDYRDAWVMGYNHRYVVGVWMGNLDNSPMDEITGSSGPALAMRAMFSELNRRGDTRGLPIARNLQRQTVCIQTGLLDDGQCATRDEWFIRGKLPASQAPIETMLRYRLEHPVDQMLVARDPRIPDDSEALELRLNQQQRVARVQWWVDGRLVATTNETRYLWPLEAGEHRFHARVFTVDDTAAQLTNSVLLTVR